MLGKNAFWFHITHLPGYICNYAIIFLYFQSIFCTPGTLFLVFLRMMGCGSLFAGGSQWTMPGIYTLMLPPPLQLSMYPWSGFISIMWWQLYCASFRCHSLYVICCGEFCTYIEWNMAIFHYSPTYPIVYQHVPLLASYFLLLFDNPLVPISIAHVNVHRCEIMHWDMGNLPVATG